MDIPVHNVVLGHADSKVAILLDREDAARRVVDAGSRRGLRFFSVDNRDHGASAFDEGAARQDVNRRDGVVCRRATMRRPLPEIGRSRIGDVGVERVASVAPLDLRQILKQMPLSAVEELAAAAVAERCRKPEVLGFAAGLKALACSAGAIDADLPVRVREDLVDLVEVRVDARPDPVRRQRTAAVMGGIEIDGEVDRCVGGLAELVRQCQRAFGVFAALLGGLFVLQIEVHALRTAMLEHHVDRQAGVLNRAQLRLGQRLAWMVVAGFADAGAVAAIIVTSDRFDPGGFKMRKVRRDIEISVNDLGAGFRAKPLARAGQHPRWHQHAGGGRGNERLQHMPAGQHPAKNFMTALISG